MLVRYVGWGGLPQVFDPNNDQWAAEYRELQGLLSPDDYTAARRSTQDAHYTSETVIRGIYQGLSRLGLGGGEGLRILEPSAGIGNFIGLCPENFNAHFMAVELDPTTSAIARYLYPEAKHLNTGFQNSLLRSGGIDAVVGNPPFGNQSLYDPDFPELRKFSIHNYFLAKSLSLLREGGVAAFVVSRGNISRGTLIFWVASVCLKPPLGRMPLQMSPRILYFSRKILVKSLIIKIG